MTTVDPFLHPIPSELQRNKETRAFFEYFVRWAHDMWVRSGGGTDEIAAVSVREVFPWDYSDTSAADSAALQSLFSSLIPEAKEWRAVTATQNYTALDHDFINAKSGAEITFPQYPSESSVMTIRNGDGSQVKLKGNGKKINGQTTGIIARKGTSIDFYYFIDSDEWFAR